MAFSFFFRDYPILEAAADIFIKNSQGKRSLKVWVAGSAMGQEVYSLAICLAEKLGYFAFNNLSITATDIEKDFGQIIQKGIYPASDLERIPPELKKKYFEEQKDKRFRIIPRLSEKVNFLHHDLLSYTSPDTEFGLILCKNVLLHLQAAERIKVYQTFHKAMAHEGILANENTQKLPEEVKSIFIPVSSEFQIFAKVTAK